VRVRAAPHEGAANDALVRVLAEALGVPPRNVTIAGGATSRIKRVSVVGERSVPRWRSWRQRDKNVPHEQDQT
jgi:uncharacterized protein